MTFIDRLTRMQHTKYHVQAPLTWRQVARDLRAGREDLHTSAEVRAALVSALWHAEQAARDAEEKRQEDLEDLQGDVEDLRVDKRDLEDQVEELEDMLRDYRARGATQS